MSIDPTLRPTVFNRLDELCDRFEKAIASGGQPLIEAYLQEAPEEDRDALLKELLLLELDYRNERSLSEFYERFPNEAAVLDKIDRPTIARTYDRVAGAETPPRLNAALPQIRAIGDYEIIEEIARGGMGVVYKARQVSLNRVVALKMIKSGELAGAQEVERFHTEAEAAASLDHPNIVPIFEVGEQDGHHFFSMGFVEGESLGAQLKNGPLPPRDAAELIRTIAEAVQYAHSKGIVHRDLKPANVLLAYDGADASGTTTHATGDTTNRARQEAETIPPLPDGRGSLSRESANHLETQQQEPGCVAPGQQGSRTIANENGGDTRAGTARLFVPKITDFGLAKNIAADSSMTATGQVMGTPNYMPPEQAAGKIDEIGPAADVYSLGAILYESLTGRPPFQAAGVLETLNQVLEVDPVPPRDLNPAVDRDLETICLKCLEKRAERRYPAGDLVAELDRYLEGRPILARPVGRWERTVRWCRRNPLGATTLGLLILFAVVGPLVAFNQYQLSEEARREKARADEKVVERDDAIGRLKSALAGETAARRLALANEQTAGENLILADVVVKDFITEISRADGVLNRHPDTQELRKTLLEKSRDYYLKLIAQNPKGNLSHRLAQANMHLGQVLSHLPGGKPRAIEAYRKSVEIGEQLKRSSTELTTIRIGLGDCHQQLGHLLRETGDPAQALTEYRHAITIHEELTREHPQTTEFQLELAESRSQFGLLLQQEGRRPEALAEFQQSLQIREKLLEQFPRDPRLRLGTALVSSNIGQFHATGGEFQEALSGFQVTHRHLISLTREFPKSAKYRQELATNHYNLGLLYTKTRRFKEAIAQLHRARTITARLAAENPRVVDYQQQLAETASSIGDLDRRTGKLQEALNWYQQALDIDSRLVRNNPSVPEYRKRQSETYESIGLVYQMQGRRPGAVSLFRLSLKIINDLVRQFPQSIEYRTVFVGTSVNMANLLRYDQPREALKLLDRAIVVVGPVLQRNLDNRRTRVFVRNAHAVRALTHESLSRFDEAVQDWKRAMQLDNGDDPNRFRLNLSRALVHAGRHAEASPLFDELMRQRLSASDRYALVINLAKCAVAARFDSKTTPRNRTALETRYADLAVAVLRPLGKSGYFSSVRGQAMLRRDPDLNPLRSRDEFRVFARSVGIRLPVWAQQPKSSGAVLK